MTRSKEGRQEAERDVLTYLVTSPSEIADFDGQTLGKLFTDPGICKAYEALAELPEATYEAALQAVQESGSEVWPHLCKAKPKHGSLKEALADFERYADPDELADNETSNDGRAIVDSYKPFPVDALPGTLKRYAVEAAESIGCDPAYVALPLLTAAGAMIGNARRLHVKNTWYALPTIWTAIVGESGTAKTPALTEALAPIKRLQRDALNRYEQQRAEYDAAVQNYDTEMAAHKNKRNTTDPPPPKPDAPTPERLTVSNATVEALAPILRDNPKGVLLHRDELAGWFGSFNRYSGKSGADEADWLSLHNGDAITVDRKTDGAIPLHVASGVVSITGGIQPAILQKAFSPEQRASGMAARLLIASPPRTTPLWSETELDHWTREKCFALFDDLASLQMESDDAGTLQSVVVKMKPEAKQAFIGYYNAHQKQQNELIGDQAAAWSKLIAYVPRFALLLHLVAQAEEPTSDDMTVESVNAAIQFVDWFKHEARRLYAVLGDNEEMTRLRQRAGWIQRKYPDGCTVRQLQQGNRDLENSQAAESELHKLAKAGLGSWDTSNRKKTTFHVCTASTVYTSAQNAES